jgi:ATP-dependent Lon protease
MAKRTTRTAKAVQTDGDDVEVPVPAAATTPGARPTITLSGAGNGRRIVVPEQLPILPLRNLVVFPGTVMPLNVGRPKSKALLEEVMPGDKLVGVISQKNADVDDPRFADLHTVGTVCMILKLFRLPDGNQSIIVHGHHRFRLHALTQEEPFHIGEIEPLVDVDPTDQETLALVGSIRQQARRLIELSPNTPEEAQQVLDSIQSAGALADFLAANLPGEAEDRQTLLETLNVHKRLREVAERLARQLDVLELQDKIQSQVKQSIDKTQRRFFLQEQLKAIRKELGDIDETGGGEIQELRERLEAAGLPEIAMKEANRELGRLESIPQASPEYGVIRTHLELMSELPWSKSSSDQIDLNKARAQLDADHFDLDKVKKRILEYLAVRKLKPDGGGAILCFLGPPGVGKTSLGKSIASATGRGFIRVALGGVRDESEIRGHRRTYIGSMPGRIISELRKAGTNNPVMMLDELDKLGNDFRGDPASALLEVLDPAQNHTFTDHYLDVPFDLSKVLFIGTANTMDTVPGPLRDRMEVIDIPGYTQADKFQIGKTYLIPRQLDANGVKKSQARFTDKALRFIIDGYTREAGVRNLERNIGSIVRSIAAEIVAGKTEKVTVDEDFVRQVLGPVRFEDELAARTSVPGVATGLAYTPFGGEILFIEATRMRGRGNITLTGQIGDVMKESATAAYSLVRSRADQMGIDPQLLADSDFHIHVPAGAVPKDGPSAGVAMFTALSSLLTNRPIRKEVAMTGEITLRGLVLPIGGLKEKTLAAKRAGITDVVIPRRNEKDLVDVPEEVRQALAFRPVDHVDEVLKIALEPKKGVNNAEAVRKAVREDKAADAVHGNGADRPAARPRRTTRRRKVTAG